MFDLFLKRDADLSRISSYISPFSSASLYRGTGAIPLEFSEALQRLLQIHLNPREQLYGGYATYDDCVVCEYAPCAPDDFSLSLLPPCTDTSKNILISYDSAKGTFRASVFDKGRFSLPLCLDDTKDGGLYCRQAVFFSLLVFSLRNKDVFSVFNDCMNALYSYRKCCASDIDSSSQSLKVIETSKMLYRSVKDLWDNDENSLPLEIPDCSFPLLEISSLLSCSKDICPVITGYFPYVSCSSSSDGTGSFAETVAGKYSPSPDRVLSEEEKMLVPVLPDSYDIPSQVITAATAVKNTGSLQIPFRNFLFRGDAGTGKTEAARLLAAACGLPYVFITCSSDTEIYDLLMQVIPSDNGEAGSFTYVDSPLIQALEHGWLVEIQEPSVILKPGVLAGLNAIWDQLGTVRLMDGRIIKRHPDTIIVMTTNTSYEGCRRLNQSVISRQNLILDFTLPEDDELNARVSDASRFTDRRMIARMISVKHAVDRILNENAVSDGDTGVRQLINWASLTRITGDPYSSALCTLISAATADGEVRTDLIHALESQFSPLGAKTERKYA